MHVGPPKAGSVVNRGEEAVVVGGLDGVLTILVVAPVPDGGALPVAAPSDEDVLGLVAGQVRPLEPGGWGRGAARTGLM